MSNILKGICREKARWMKALANAGQMTLKDHAE